MVRHIAFTAYISAPELEEQIKLIDNYINQLTANSLPDKYGKL